MTDAVCSIDGCGKKVQARGLCSTHYGRWRRNGTTDTVYRRTDIHVCTIEGCANPVHATGLCQMHYTRRRRGSEDAQVPARVHGGPLLDRVHRRMGTPDAGGHQLWTGPVTGSSELPVVRHETTSVSARRLLWEAANPGKKLGRRWVVTSCRVPRCVAPEHLVVTTIHQYNSKESVTSR